MAGSPIIESNTIVSYKITSNGQEIPGTFGTISIRISSQINTIAEAQISIRDGNASDQVFTITDAKTFEPGSKVVISLGYNGKNTEVFSGLVMRQSIRVDESGTNLDVTCKDSLIKITKTKSKVVLTNAKDSEAIEKIISTGGFEKKVSATKVVQEKIVQYNATDWDFIVNRAELNGMVVVTNNGTLVVSPPEISSDPVLSLTYGQDILEMSTELEATNQYESIAGTFWDESKQELVKVEAEKSSENNEGDLSESKLEGVLNASVSLDGTVSVTQEAVQAITDAARLKSQLSRYRGTIVFQGFNMSCNTLVKLSGLGERFDGNAYVSGVTQSISDGQWRTEVQLGTSPEWFSEKAATTTGPAASGALKGVTGLLTAKVVSIYSESDENAKVPEKEFKVQLKIPGINNDNETVWARLSTFYASNGFGAFFYPEVNDEVIVGFMDGDPRFPIIIGSVYSSALAPPVPIENANNYIKALVTKSKMQLQFDDENIILTISTPNKNTITISDKDKKITVEDQNKNTLTMDENGITMNSEGAIKITASKEIEIKGDSVTISASQGAALLGDECNITSQGNTNISGTEINLN